MRKDIFNEIHKHLNNFSYDYVMLLYTNPTTVSRHVDSKVVILNVKWTQINECRLLFEIQQWRCCKYDDLSILVVFATLLRTKFLPSITFRSKLLNIARSFTWKVFHMEFEANIGGRRSNTSPHYTPKRKPFYVRS